MEVKVNNGHKSFFYEKIEQIYLSPLQLRKMFINLYLVPGQINIQLKLSAPLDVLEISRKVAVSAGGFLQYYDCGSFITCHIINHGGACDRLPIC